MRPPNSELQQFMSAIARVESGGESDPYTAQGPRSHGQYGHAQGKYQIMSGIWPSWAAQYGYSGLSESEFLNNVGGVQDKIAAARMSDYYERYDGNWSLVAAAWFGGQGAADRARDRGLSSTASLNDGGINVPTYVQRVMSGFEPTGEPSPNQQLTSLGIVERAMQGLTGLTVTSTYRDPEKNESVGGSATSWHLNKDNPAVDIAGPEDQLDELARRLSSMGLNAELLWKTEGHNDHVHFALRDGSVSDHAMSAPNPIEEVPTGSPQRQIAQSVMQRMSDLVSKDPGNPELYESVRLAMRPFFGPDRERALGLDRADEIEEEETGPPTPGWPTKQSSAGPDRLLRRR